MTDIDLHRELSHTIIGIAMQVHASYGSGHKEIIYEKALIGWYQPDFLIEEKLILELKATEYSIKSHETQLRDYLKVSPIELGYVINFGMPSLYFRRIIYTNDRKVN